MSGDADHRAKPYAACFATASGREVLADLRRRTIERDTPADMPEAELRHLEGQRHLVRTIENLIKRGQS